MPDDPPEFQPNELTRENLVSNVMRDLVAREALSGVALSETEFQSSLQRTMRFAAGDVWIFAYGSLIWNPLFPFVERHVARVFGYRRSFLPSLHRRPRLGSKARLDAGPGYGRDGRCGRLPDTAGGRLIRKWRFFGDAR
ncbi:gamma-glutamylcyclotransferase [Bradyrhizobium sp. Pear77]|uniref:gamma-glutamylcyclotransferase n=1 Tax=Bradyrhizobium altum TaxID=1571202 RepID=UPI001E50AB24|nr:gamma-glutamylcyclotransferase [Bradyrhizobium altum]MCC8953380.1 gamma-glutamylcyclotransferase [Bradyrhizobium altum]